MANTWPWTSVGEEGTNEVDCLKRMEFASFKILVIEEWSAAYFFSASS